MGNKHPLYTNPQGGPISSAPVSHPKATNPGSGMPPRLQKTGKEMHLKMDFLVPQGNLNIGIPSYSQIHLKALPPTV